VWQHVLCTDPCAIAPQIFGCLEVRSCTVDITCIAACHFVLVLRVAERAGALVLQHPQSPRADLSPRATSPISRLEACPGSKEAATTEAPVSESCTSSTQVQYRTAQHYQYIAAQDSGTVRRVQYCTTVVDTLQYRDTGSNTVLAAFPCVSNLAGTQLQSSCSLIAASECHKKQYQRGTIPYCSACCA